MAGLSAHPRLLAASVILALAVPVWLLIVAPKATTIPEDFRYQAKVISFDNFYDPKQRHFMGAKRSETRFSYDVVAREDDALIVRNVFDVRKLSGEKIFAVERLYGIDPGRGVHIAGHGDRNRSGYLFGPHSADKSPFTYWHVNYNSPAQMKFQDKERIAGLTVYRYAARFSADQTQDLTHLPGVPEKRGVRLDVSLETWIEPKTGRSVKYEDRTIAYYYDRFTKKRLYPWNKFHNRYDPRSIAEQAQLARNAARKVTIYKLWIPLFLVAMSFACIAVALVIKRRSPETGALDN